MRSQLPPGTQIRDWTVDHASYFRAIRIEKTMVAIILMLIVAVAAFYLVAMLAMVVTDKRNDIAILRFDQELEDPCSADQNPTGQVAVVVSRRRGQAVFEASGLPEVAAARTYQLWVVDRSGPRPAGLVEPGGAGKVTRLLEGRVTGSEQVAMTVEQRGGAARPTSEPVVVVDLRA